MKAERRKFAGSESGTDAFNLEAILGVYIIPALAGRDDLIHPRPEGYLDHAGYGRREIPLLPAPGPAPGRYGRGDFALDRSYERSSG